MSSYFSLTFILFFLPLSVLAYSIVPQRARWAVLLGASYAFFWCLSRYLIAFIIASTASIYVCGLIMARLIKKRDAALAEAGADKSQVKKRCKRNKRGVLAAGVLFNLGVLISLKYLDFFVGGATSLLSLMGISVSATVPKIGVPIGISFYTLMAISYLVDVYQETVPADRHIGHVALYLSFFPQIMEGPICRYGQTAGDLHAGKPIKGKNVYEGSLRILFGLAKKIIVADRLNIFVKTVFSDYGSYDGGIVAFAAVLYTLQLYCDFSGTMDIAIGIGHIFNVNLPENFRQPFFSRTASEFWHRWHITLGTWFKSYVYYPVSLSKPCKRLTKTCRKKFGNRYGPLLASFVAMLCVWLGNGLWHGAGSQYLFFGMYYFVIIMAGSLIEPLAQLASQRFGIDRNCIAYRAFQIARTLVIVFVGELFFRADGFDAGMKMFTSILTNFSLDSFFQGAFLSLGLDMADFAVVAVMTVALLVIGILRERGHELSTELAQCHVFVKWGAWVGLLVATVMFGAYGVGYVPVDPMYAQF